MGEGGYHIRCICGEAIITALRQLKCPKCGRQLTIDWRAGETIIGRREQPKTISEKYDE
jgi:predicted RNA-binding Zn-ribbon protein involved in translation (DUF1610 family)